MDMEWMAWTPVTAVFFTVIILMLITMGVLEAYWPTTERRGLLPMPTTRGDRLFIGLLCSAYITIGWMGLTEWSLFLVLPVLVVFIGLVLRYG